MATALVAVVVGLAAAGAAVAGTTQVSGVQTPIDPSAGTYTMSGSLIGLWTITSIELANFTPSGAVLASGTEQFDGCFDTNANRACDGDDPQGSIFFTFTLTAKYDPTFTVEQHGRCHHPVVGGTGGFAGVSGSLDFKDDPVTGCASYKGHLDL
jgi:hypothetical protein